MAAATANAADPYAALCGKLKEISSLKGARISLCFSARHCACAAVPHVQSGTAPLARPVDHCRCIKQEAYGHTTPLTPS
jgi:hypothetical protein